MRLSDRTDSGPWECEEYDVDDEGPLLKYRYYTKHLSDYSKKRRRRTCSVARLFLFSLAAILICFFMYFPVYRSAYKIKTVAVRGIVAGWSVDTNRDTKIYVKPNNITTRIQPKNICKNNKNKKLLLLVFVCSNLNRSEHRKAIRKAWANNREYKKLDAIYKKIKERYKNYNFSYELEIKKTEYGYNNFIQSLANVYKNVENISLVQKQQTVLPVSESNQYNEENEELGEDFNYDYYESNVMKIPPKGYEDDEGVNKILDIIKNKFKTGNTDKYLDVEFKVVFLLGLPADNKSGIQGEIEKEAKKYGDIIQEDFIDTYNNLTLKSIMMLKWVLHNCDNKVRYILKSDDDTFINMPVLMSELHNHTRRFEKNKLMYNKDGKEYLLLGNLVNRAKPVLDSKNKWFSPPYMYKHTIYPPYLSGTAYLMSLTTAEVLYKTALTTPYLHLEDIFITGLCSNNSSPRIRPRNIQSFTKSWPGNVCMGTSFATLHHITPKLTRDMYSCLQDEDIWDRCERERLNKLRREQMKKKKKVKVTRT